MTIRTRNQKQQDNRHFVTATLHNWCSRFALTHLSLWEQVGDRKHCIWAFPQQDYIAALPKKADCVSVADHFLLVFDTEKTAVFRDYLQQCRTFLPVCFEAALALEKRSVEEKLWLGLSGEVLNDVDDSFYTKLLDTLITGLPGAEAGLLLLNNERTSKLVIESGSGFDHEYYQRIQLSSDESIAGTAFSKQELLVYNTKTALQQAMASLSPKNRDYLIQAAQWKRMPSTALAFPIINNQQSFGVVVLFGFSDGSCFSPEIVDTLQNVLNYISLLYGRYKNQREAKKTKRELDITYRALRTEHSQLRKTLDLYNILTALSRNNKGINEIMSAMYSTAHTPIVYYDELLFPIASCGTSEQHVLPDHFLKTREARYSVRVKKWQLLKLTEDELLLIIPVVGAERVIGFLCAWINKNTFNDSDRTLLEYSASFLGLESMKRQAVEQTKRQLFGDIFDQVLSNTFNENMLQQAKNLDLNEKDLYTVLICEYTHAATPGIQEQFASEACMKWLEQALKEVTIKGLVAHRRGAIVAFLSFPSDAEKRTIDSKLTRFSTRINQFPGAIKVGIGRLEEGFIRINQSYNDARQCIRLLKKKKSGKVYRFSSGGIDHLLMNHDPDELKLFVEDHLGLLLEYDARKHKELLKTLLVYLEHNRNLQKTTEALMIHHNTLYYRINQIEAILSVKLSHSEDWMNLAMACRIYQFLQG